MNVTVTQSGDWKKSWKRCRKALILSKDSRRSLSVI